jgi:ZIP family zinc transporter
MLEAQDVFWLAFIGSVLATCGTFIGAAVVFIIRKRDARTEIALLSAAAGVMLAATFFSLLLPAVQSAQVQFASRFFGIAVVACGLLSGAAVLLLVHRRAPHEHFVLGREGPDVRKLQRVWLFVIAIALHNFPEGMAIGVGFAGTEISNGIALATGIGLQNVPEGLAVAAAMIAAGYARPEAFWVACLTGLVEPLGGAFGSAAVWLAEPLMPWVLGFTAGGMLFVISDEIIPETHRSGHESVATFALLIGFALMMFLDAAFG